MVTTVLEDIQKLPTYVKIPLFIISFPILLVMGMIGMIGIVVWQIVIGPYIIYRECCITDLNDENINSSHQIPTQTYQVPQT